MFSQLQIGQFWSVKRVHALHKAQCKRKIHDVWKFGGNLAHFSFHGKHTVYNSTILMYQFLAAFYFSKFDEPYVPRWMWCQSPPNMNVLMVFNEFCDKKRWPIKIFRFSFAWMNFIYIAIWIKQWKMCTANKFHSCFLLFFNLAKKCLWLFMQYYS